MTSGSAGDRGALSAVDLARLLASAGGTATWHWFGGHAFAVVGDLDPLRELFEVEGCVVTAARTCTDGYVRLAARQVTIFRDAVSREVIERWRNPYTQQDLPVAHQHEPAIRAVLEGNAPAASWLGTGDRVAVFLDSHSSAHFPLAPAAANPEDLRRATSCTQLVVSRDQLRDAARNAVDYSGAWESVSDWPAWLAMGTQPGYLFQRVFVRKARDRDDIPEPLRKAVLQRFPDGLDAPAVA